MNDPPAKPSVSGSISQVTGQAAIGTNIRQQAIFLTVEIASGDPAALDRVAQQIRLNPISDRVTAWGKDFVGLIGRDAEVAAARDALDSRRSVAAFGEDGIGKTVLLRHLARRASVGFSRGVARIPTAGDRWQDIGNAIVKAFFNAELPIYLGPMQLQKVLTDLDVLILLDDVAPDADIEELFALLETPSFVVASTERLLGGESRAIHLDGLDRVSAAMVIGQALLDFGVKEPAIDSAVAERIGAALGGNPHRIIRTVADAQARHIDLAALAEELDKGPGSAVAAAASLNRLGSNEVAVVDAVAALDGAPIGAEHVAAILPGVSTSTVDALELDRVLRAASPQVRLDPDLAAAHEAGGMDPDDLRARYLDHFISWTSRDDASVAAIADESRAILYLIDWAIESGRNKEAQALSVATESAFALAGRWGAWARATTGRLQAAEALGDDADAAVALNQLGVQALGQDAVEQARESFAKAHAWAVEARAPAIAAVAKRNLDIVDGLLLPQPKDDRHGDNGDNGKGDGLLRRITRWWTRHVPGLPLMLGLVGLAVVASLLYLFLADRRALAIEPGDRAFQAASVDADGEKVLFTVTNRGSATLEGLDVAVTGGASDEFFVVGGDCPGSRLTGGQSCSVAVLFHPTRAGDGLATLTVTARDGTVVTASIESRASEPTATPTTMPTESPAAPSQSAPPIQGKADLAIASFFPTGSPERGDYWLVPVKVVIVNAGKGDAREFPIVITADKKPVPFDVSGEDPNNLVTRAPLRPGERITYDGNVWLNPGTRFDEVRLVVEADSCARDPSASPICRVAEPNERNNSYPLQSVDLQVTNLKVGEPQEPPGPFIAEPAGVNVPVSFDLRNAGVANASEFWIAAFVGQVRPYVEVKGLDIDQSRGLPRVPELGHGAVIYLEGLVVVPRTNLDSQLTIVTGCPPGSEPCQLPEIALDNNFAVGAIPLPSTPTPPPTAPPIQ